MQRYRPTKPIRLLLATLVLVGNIGSSPTFSHTHARPGSSHDAHHDHIDHDHLYVDSPSDHDLDHEDAVSADDATSHLHGVWLGIPFNLPNAPGQEGSRPGLLPLSDACLTLTADVDADHFGSKSPLGSPVWGYLFSLRAHREPSSPPLPTILFSHGANSPCALLAHSVMLRC